MDKQLDCWECNTKVPVHIRVDEYWFFCSAECKEKYESRDLQKRLKSLETHSPFQRRPQTEGEIKAMGILRPAVHVIPTVPTDAFDSQIPPSLSTSKPDKKGGRKCGKCGGSGHNSRTCGKKKYTGLPDSLLTPIRQRPEVDLLKEPETPYGIPKPRKIADHPKKNAKHGGRKCGKCGKSGHNSRTCQTQKTK